MMHHNIKAIVFDYGGVLELNGAGGSGGGLLGGIAKVVGAPLDEFKAEYFKHNHLFNVENVPWEEMITVVVSKFTSNEELKENVLSLVEEYNSKKVMNTELAALIPALKGQGLKVAIFSNDGTKLRTRLHENGLAPLMDEIVISGEIGFQKPNREAFQILFEKLKLQPEEIVFIDDTPKSLEGAGEIGYVPILFKNNEQLKADLKALGILTDPS